MKSSNLGCRGQEKGFIVFSENFIVAKIVIFGALSTKRRNTSAFNNPIVSKGINKKRDALI